jgi:hypothetical protein
MLPNGSLDTTLIGSPSLCSRIEAIDSLASIFAAQP